MPNTKPKTNPKATAKAKPKKERPAERDARLLAAFAPPPSPAPETPASRANALLAAAREAEADDPDEARRLVVQSIQEHETRDARACLADLCERAARKAAASASARHDAALARGRACLDACDRDGAASAVEDALAASPASTDALALRAQIDRQEIAWQRFCDRVAGLVRAAVSKARTNAYAPRTSEVRPSLLREARTVDMLRGSALVIGSSRPVGLNPVEIVSAGALERREARHQVRWKLTLAPFVDEVEKAVLAD